MPVPRTRLSTKVTPASITFPACCATSPVPCWERACSPVSCVGESRRRTTAPGRSSRGTARRHRSSVLVYNVAPDSSSRTRSPSPTCSTSRSRSRSTVRTATPPSTDGGGGLEELDEPQRHHGSWITTSRTDLTLKPHQAVKIPFAIKAPAGDPVTTPGPSWRSTPRSRPGGGETQQPDTAGRWRLRCASRVQGLPRPGWPWSGMDRAGRSTATIHYMSSQHWQRPPQSPALTRLTGVFGHEVSDARTPRGTLLPGGRSRVPTGDRRVAGRGPRHGHRRGVRA